MSASPYSDLDRPPLNAGSLARGLLGDTSLWQEIRVLERTGSTNADVAVEAVQGAPEGLVIVAESQSAGRGRTGRSWTSPPRAGLTFSALLRPGPVPVQRWVWLPLLAGLATAHAAGRLAELDVRLKWPNDLLAGERKLAGILAEQSGDAVVLGIGLNVTTRPEELPVPTATSLLAEQAACTDRDPLLRAVLRELADRYLAWREAGGDPDASRVRAEYLKRCATLGRPVRVELPDGTALEGEAVDVDDHGRLLVQAVDGTHAVGAGDVLHVR